MAILTTVNWISEARVDISDMRRIESAVRNDFDTLVTSVFTNTGQGYIIRGFSIVTGGAILSPANSLQMVVDPGAVLHIAASVSGTIFQTPIGTPDQTLNAATNPNVSGSFTASSTNYVGIDYNRFADPTTDVTKYIWNESAKDEIPEIAPAAQTLTYKIFITTSVWAANVLPVAIVKTDSNGNVLSITDARWMIYSLGTGGINPDPNHVFPWSAGRNQSPATTTSDSIDPFHGGDKQLTCFKDWADAVMSELLEIKGTSYWFSGTGGGGGPIPTLQSLFQDLGNTVITGSGEISNGILPNSEPILITTGNITTGSNQLSSLGSVAGLSNGTFVFGTGIPAGTTIISVSQYSFTVTAANATAGTRYTNNGQTFTVTSTITGATTLVATGTGAPTASGTLTLVAGTGPGDATIAFSAFTTTSTAVTMSQAATLNGTGVGVKFFSPGVLTAPGQINWDDAIKIRVIGSSLTYTLDANPSSAYITLADDEAAYVVLGRELPISPNLIFSTGSAVVTSAGAVTWTPGFLPGDYIKIASNPTSDYYQILSIDSGSQVTLTTPVLAPDNTGPSGAQAQQAYGRYHASPTPIGDPRAIQISTRETVPVDKNTFWLFLREDNGGSPRVYIRFLSQELDNGESVEVSGTTSEELLKYIGAASAASSKPLYVAALNPGSVAQVTSISIGGGATITGGQYFLMSSSAGARNYVIWFKVNGVGTAPSVPNTNGLIEVDILSTDNAAAVATKLENALNTTLSGDFSAVTGSEYVFTTSSANATVGATYSNNSQTFTVVNTITGGTTLVSTGTGAPALSGSPSLLGSAATFALLASSAITNTGASTITGNVGLTPGSSITPGGWTVTGTIHVDDATAATAQSDANSAYTTLAAHSSTVIPSALDGQTLTAGYYSFSSGAATLATSGPATLTFSGSATDVFVIKTASTLTTGAGGIPTMALIGGALPNNIYWVIGSSATINSGSAGTFQGNIIAQASITDTMGGTVNGSMVALTGAITLSAATNANAIAGASGTLTKVTGTGDASITFSAFTSTGAVIVTNTSAGTANPASNFNVGAPFTVFTTVTGTGAGNYVIHDGDSLTLAIKELDQAIGALQATVNYDEVIEVVASGGTYPALNSPVSINGPVSSGTILSLPNNSREGNLPLAYIVGKGGLMVFLNGQFLDLESGAYLEVGAGGSASNQIQILFGLVVGDEMEFRLGGGGGGSSGIGPVGPAGPAGANGFNAAGGPVVISTKTSSYTVLSSDCFLRANCASGPVTLTLPAAAVNTGRIFYFKKVDSTANNMIIMGNGGELIDGFNTQITNTQYYEWAVISNGTSWDIF